MPRVSIVMSVYNGAQHLPSTIDSILAQTEEDFELIVVDDGSSDATPEILNRSAAADPRIRVIRQDNTGLTKALIVGCSAARAVYIARHDAGDLSNPSRLATQCQMLDLSHAAFASCATRYVGPEGEDLWVIYPTGVALSPTDVLDPELTGGLRDGPTHHGSVMFRRDAYERVGGYRAQFYYGQDFDLWFRLAAWGKFVTTNEVLYTARITPHSISGLAREPQQRLANLSRAALDARLRHQSEASILAEAETIGRLATKTRSGRGLYFIGEALRRRGDARARTYLRRAIAAQPFDLRAWVRLAQSMFGSK